MMFKGEHYLKPCISWSSHLHSLTQATKERGGVPPTGWSRQGPFRLGGRMDIWSENWFLFDAQEMIMIKYDEIW